MILDNGVSPPILTFGPLWICEWLSTWQAADATVGNESFRAFANAARFQGGHEADS